jgi:anti-anti-sigma regulatory factor
VTVAVLAVHGDLDASNYQDLIARAKAAYDAGTRDVLIDLSAATFVSSSGLVALHSIAKLLRGEPAPNADEGWGALHAVGSGLGNTVLPHIKLLNPSPKVERVLDKAGLKSLFQIHTDLAAAIASF